MTANFRFRITLLLLLIFSGCGKNLNSYDVIKPPGEGPTSLLPPLGTPTDTIQSPPVVPAGLALIPYYEAKSVSLVQPARQMNVNLFMSVDNSGSMTQRLIELESQIGLVLDGLSASGVGFKIGVFKSTDDGSGRFGQALYGPNRIVSSDSPSAQQELLANLVSLRNSSQSGMERPVGILFDAISHVPNRDFVNRAGAHSVYWVISDAIDLDYSATSSSTQFYADFMRDFFQIAAPNGSWMMTTLGNPSFKPCPDSEFSKQDLIEKITLKSGGEMARVCDSALPGPVTEITRSIMSLVTSISLKTMIADTDVVDPQSIEVEVSSVLIPLNNLTGFYWNPHRAAISFPGSYRPVQGETIEVRFDLVNL